MFMVICKSPINIIRQNLLGRYRIPKSALYLKKFFSYESLLRLIRMERANEIREDAM